MNGRSIATLCVRWLINLLCLLLIIYQPEVGEAKTPTESQFAFQLKRVGDGVGRKPRSSQPICDAVTMESGGRLDYCLTIGTTNQIIVYLPGIMNDESAAGEAVAISLLETFQRLHGVTPNLITVSLGKVHFLSGRRRTTGYTDVEEISRAITAILKQNSMFGGRYPKPELFGNSMGGFNALMIFARHPEQFRRLALACPAGTRVSPFASMGDWKRNQEQERADFWRSFGFRELLLNFYGSAEQWNTESPLEFLRTRYRPVARPQPVFIGTVINDPFGFTLVQDSVQAAFEKYGHRVSRFRDDQAEHCYIRSEPLVDFFNGPTLAGGPRGSQRPRTQTSR